jgi:hypothetical protein
MRVGGEGGKTMGFKAWFWVDAATLQFIAR